ncbi:DUF6441 family protein [Oleispirillum naphthae]|uniref:DUF6441 family protein n=1 Tax=Oleispirillum naphthae TaxID=2838853 RepID=UPI00308256D8
MKIGAALEGDLRKIMTREISVLRSGIKSGTQTATDNLKEKLRAQVRAAGLPQSVQKAWQSKVYPKGDSMGAAGLVFSKATRIHAAFDAGASISPRNGQWLVIPLPAARRLKFDVSYSRSRGGKPRHWSDVDAAVRRFGSLRRVPLKGGRILLVADGVTASGSRRKVRQAKGGGTVQGVGNVSMPLFLLVKRVRLGKRLDIGGAAAQAGRDFMGHVLAGIDAADRRVKE